MLFVLIAIALFIFWPESRPFVIGLAILTIVGILLTANQRLQTLGSLRALLKTPRAHAADEAAYNSALEREDYDAAQRVLDSSPEFAAHLNAKRAAFLDVALGDRQAEPGLDDAARTKRSEAAKKGAATRRARQEQRLAAPPSAASIEEVPPDRPGTPWPPSE